MGRGFFFKELMFKLGLRIRRSFQNVMNCFLLQSSFIGKSMQSYVLKD